MGDLLIMSKKELRRKSIFDLVKLGQITLILPGKIGHFAKPLF